MEGQYLAVYEGSGNQGGNFNRSGSCSADPAGHFGHLVAIFLMSCPGLSSSLIFARLGQAREQRNNWPVAYFG